MFEGLLALTLTFLPGFLFLSFKRIFPDYFLNSFWAIQSSTSLRSRRLEVVGTRKNARERRRRVSLARPFSLSPTTSKRLLLR